MAAGYIPGGDGPFDVWQRNFAGYVTAHFRELGLTVEEVTRLKSATLPWEEAYAAHGAARAAAKAARVEKVERRGDYERVIRELGRRIQAGESVTDEQRAALGLTVRDTQPTPVGAPKTRPLVVVEAGERLRHTLRYADESTPTRRARPRGVMGVEVWVKVAPAGGAENMPTREAVGMAPGYQSSAGDAPGYQPSMDEAPGRQSSADEARGYQSSADEAQSSIHDPRFSPVDDSQSSIHDPRFSPADEAQSSIHDPQSSPVGPEELTFVMLSTRTPAVVDYDGADGGLTAHYMLRWLSTRGEVGPWSETASATIGV